jgi:hypothetical protein
LDYRLKKFIFNADLLEELLILDKDEVLDRLDETHIAFAATEVLRVVSATDEGSIYIW